jgi:hypothetical protein
MLLFTLSYADVGCVNLKFHCLIRLNHALLNQAQGHLEAYIILIYVCRSEVFENRVLRGICGPKREDLMRLWNIVA